MKIIKYLFFLILIVFIGGALYFATKDGNFQIEKNQIIEAPVEVVFKKVNDYKTWENWGPLKKEDSTMVFNYPEKTSGEGASYSWNGKDWDGSMKTTEVIPDQSIKQEINFKLPTGERTATVYWRFEEVAEGTKVIWGLQGEHSLIDKAYFSIFKVNFATKAQKMMAEGLVGLNADVQKDLQVYTINVNGVTQYGGGFYMYASTATTLEALDQKLAQLIPKVSNYMEANSITKAGKPLTVYNKYDTTNDSAIISSGIPTTTRVIVPENSDILCGFLPAQTVVKTTLKGNYKNLTEAYSKTMDYVKENGYQQPEDSSPFEIYVTAPDNEPNPANWITEIYIPISTQDTTEETVTGDSPQL